MAKKYRSKKNSKATEFIFLGLIVATVILVIALVIIQHTSSDSYVITEDGHVHAADGTHIGTYDELFGSLENTEGTEDTAEESAEPAAEPTAEPAE